MSSRKMRVLFQARQSLFSTPGGDTTVIINLKRLLRSFGVEIELSHIPQSLDSYDLVHIFNCEFASAFNTISQAKPYILTPLYEDAGLYIIDSFRYARLLRDVIKSGHDDWHRDEWAKPVESSKRYSPPEMTVMFDNADAIISSGRAEADAIRADFPEAARIEIVHFGCDRPAFMESVTEDPFVSRFGIRDFILCVGRLETRKNQLMLLHALRHDDVPVVFVNVTGVQPAYEKLCKGFRRKGTTTYTGSVSKEMLFSAYKAAGVHVLPSWYELPGLVSLEAAWFGCPVVASDRGTLRDYLSDYAYYCDPGDPHSVRSAVLSAMKSPRNESAQKILESFTWDRYAENVLHIYESVISRCSTRNQKRRLSERSIMAQREFEYLELRNRALSMSRKDPGEAIRIASILMRHHHDDVVIKIIKGISYLHLMKYFEAESYLKAALDLQPCGDIQLYLYLALTQQKQGRFREVENTLARALDIYPFLPDETRSFIDSYLKESRDAFESVVS